MTRRPLRATNVGPKVPHPSLSLAHPQISFTRYNFDVCGISRQPLHPVAPSQHPRRVKTCFYARKRLLPACMPILSLCAPLGSPCTRSARGQASLHLNTAPPLPRAAPSLPSTLCSQPRRSVANNCFRYKGTTFLGLCWRSR
jgi:hypothetical protein